MFANPQPDLFQTFFPRDMFYPDIIEKFNAYLRIRNNIFTDFVDFLNSNIQGITMPSYTTNVVEQQVGVPSTTRQQIGTFNPLNAVGDRTVTITLKHTNGYLVYWFLLEHYLLQFMNKPEYPRIDTTLLVNVLSVQKDKLLTVKYSNVNFVSIDAIELSYDTQLTQFNTFSIGLSFNGLDTEFNLPKAKKTITDSNYTK